MTSTLSIAERGSFRAMRLFHPTVQVPDLAEAEDWFLRAFGRESTSLSAILPSTPEYPTEYSTFTVIRDVLIDSIDPKLHFVAGKQRYPAVQTPALKGIGWYVDGMTECYRELRRQGIRCMDLSNNVAEGEDPPLSPGGGVMTYFTVADDAGLQYQFFREGPFPLDPRATPGWILPPIETDDPLRIEHCSHHTILTRQPERALKFAVDALGGSIVHQGRNELLGTSSVYVALADGLLEYAVPDRGTRACADLDAHAPYDSYYTMTWKVEDLGQVERHLAEIGVSIGERTDETIIARSDTSLGVPWGFTTGLIPGDPRGISAVA